MTAREIPYKIYLDESEIPTAWYNVRADMKNKPAPLLNPGTHQPMTAQELSAVFCEDLVAQELDNDTRLFPIPQEIQDFYRMYRPSPLVRAYCLEKKLQTPAHIYYKFEGSGNDPTALGAYAACDAAGVSPLIYGVDGSPDIKALLGSTCIEGTGAQSPITIGKTIAETAYKWLDGEEVEEYIPIETFLITEDNVDEYGKDGWQ